MVQNIKLLTLWSMGNLSHIPHVRAASRVHTRWRYGLSLACRCRLDRGICFYWLAIAFDQAPLSRIVISARGSWNSL